MTPRHPILAALSLLAAPLCGQSFVDLVESRNPAQPYLSLLQIEAGVIGAVASDEDPTVGLEDDISWDARIYYRDEGMRGRSSTLEAYAGRDGLFAGWYDGSLIGDDTVTRFEFHGRPWQFYRDGFYRGDQLVPNGLYEGSDYEGYIGFGREAQEGLYIELGPFYRQNDFRRSDLSRNTTPQFVLPDDYAAYGGRLYLEQSAVQLDRRRGLPRDGYVLSLSGEREWNDSERRFGLIGGYESTLPAAVWRARGRLEWYIPTSDDACWEVFARGGWGPEEDRVQNYDGSRPLGNIWADAQIRVRLHLGESITVTPFVHGQLSRLLRSDGFASTYETFLGGGAEAYLHLSQVFSVHGYYSFLDNENRPSIRIDDDVRGQHLFYLGLVARFGGRRR